MAVREKKLLVRLQDRLIRKDKGNEEIMQFVPYLRVYVDFSDLDFHVCTRNTVRRLIRTIVSNWITLSDSFLFTYTLDCILFQKETPLIHFYSGVSLLCSSVHYAFERLFLFAIVVKNSPRQNL